MIQRPKNTVKWTRNQWRLNDTDSTQPQHNDKKWNKNLEEVDTDATGSWSENIDQTLSDVQVTSSKLVTIEILGKSLTVDCLDIEDVKSLLIRVGSMSQLQQRTNMIKMVILDSLCKQNKLLIPLLDRQCKQYSNLQAKLLFL